MPAPANWYDDPDDATRLRYWDGQAWTEHFAAKSPSGVVAEVPEEEPHGVRQFPAAAPSTVSTTEADGKQGRRRRWRVSTVLIAVVVLLLTVIAVASGGPAGLFILPGLFAFATGAYVLVTGRKSWLQLSTRPLGLGVLAGGLVAVLIGGGVAGATGAVPIPQPSSSFVTSPARSASARPTPSVTPTPTPSPSVELDPDIAVAPAGGTEVAASAPSTSARALDVLATITIKGRAPKTGYDREDDFGTAWLDVDRNGCDTRNDILQRDLADEVLSGPCKVLTGTLRDPYTARTISFVRGNTTSTLVQIDHVVALMDAWQKGAQQLTYDQRVSLANDPLNLFAVDGPTNSGKGAGDAATWLPPNRSFRCTYVARQVAVKATYGLWMTQAEHDAIAAILGSCPDEVAPSSSFAPAPPPPPAPVPAPAPAPAAPQPAPAAPAPAPAAPAPAPAPVAPAPAPAPAAPASAYYENCDAVRAAGAAPIRAGDPGYSRKLDRDGDGTGCE